MQSFSARQVELLTEPECGLVSRIKHGDQFALRELFRRFYSSLCRFTNRLIPSKEDVEDIVESVFEKVWLNRETLDPDQSIKSYLFKAAQNRAYDFLRKQGNKQIAFSKWAPPEEKERLRVLSCSDPFQDMMDTDLIAAVSEAIERLPHKCRSVFTLNRQDGLTYSEIADVLDISERTVENHIARALKHLRKDLKDFIG